MLCHAGARLACTSRTKLSCLYVLKTTKQISVGSDTAALSVTHFKLVTEDVWRAGCCIGIPAARMGWGVFLHQHELYTWSGK